MAEHYVYILFRPDGRPCYVGKGKGRRWYAHDARPQNPHLRNIIAAAAAPLPKIKVREHLTETEAFATEAALIAAIGRKVAGGPLVNMTDGGDGPRGHSLSPEHREAIRRAASTPEAKDLARLRATGNSNRCGKLASTETKARISASKTGKPSPKNKKRSDTGKPRPPHIVAMLRARKGEKRSAEARANIIAGKRAAWAKRKATGEMSNAPA